MGRIISSVRISNPADPTKTLRCDALVDTGASYLVLPSAWRERLGELEEMTTLQLETETGEALEGLICGPVRIQIEGFRPIHSDVCFVDMKPKDGVYDPLIGYIVLEQSQAAVDTLGHRLVHVSRMDLKSCDSGRSTPCRAANPC